MIGFLKWWWQGSAKSDSDLERALEMTKQDILRMPFLQLATYIRDMDDRAPMAVFTAITQRLYEISRYDNHVPNEHREGALKLLETVKSTVEQTLKDNPTVLIAYREANSFMEEKARMIGVGSLAWKMQEYGIPSDEMVPFIARPEHSHLLDDFLSTLGPELAERVKRELERHAAESGQG